MHFQGIMDNDDSIRIALFLRDPGTAMPLKNLLKSNGFLVEMEAEVKGGTSFLKTFSPADFTRLRAVVLDLVGQADPQGFAREVCARCPADAVVVALGSENDISFYRRLRTVGVSEYFVSPVPAEELLQSLRTLLRLDSAVQRRGGRMVVVYGVHGGVGAGLLTAGLGAWLSQKHGRDTVVLDADMASPSVGSYLSCDQSGNLKGLLEAGERLDRELVRQAVLSPMSGLALLDGWEPLGEHYSFTEQGVSSLSDLLGGEYRYQVWRCNGASPLRSCLMGAADVALVVMSGSLASAKAGQTVLRWMAERNRKARIITLYNNTSPRQTIPQTSLEGVLGRKMDYTLPYLRRLSDDLLNGVTFTSSSHCLHETLEKLSADLLGMGATGKTSWWKRLAR